MLLLDQYLIKLTSLYVLYKRICFSYAMNYTAKNVYRANSKGYIVVCYPYGINYNKSTYSLLSFQKNAVEFQICDKFKLYTYVWFNIFKIKSESY